MTGDENGAALASAFRERSLVRVYHGGDRFDGRVIGLSEELIAFAILNAGIRYDGLVVWRWQGLENVEAPHPHSAFYEAVLSSRRHNAPKPIRDLRGMAELLRWARAAFSLVRIHPRADEPSVSHIGEVVDVSDETVTLREIDADARFEAETKEHRLGDIVRVDLGGAYEEALALGSRLHRTNG